ncbi:MAG: hypothetical protein Q8M03_13610 [Legionella sp.]|nr:hypothetical protein [Legionella sp.]
MKENYHVNSTKPTPRENFLISLLNKIMKEYKALLEHTRRIKPFKIIEIINLSNIPGESKFAIQLTNKDCYLHITAAEIITANYDLNDFTPFHAEIIRQAAYGKLIEFLKSQGQEKPTYKIISKKINRDTQQFIFTIEKNNEQFIQTAEEISRDIDVLANMDIQDIYDIGYTQGSESILKEKMALLLAKKQYNIESLK